VVECTGFENRQGRKSLVGSNPTGSDSWFRRGFGPAVRDGFAIIPRTFVRRPLVLSLEVVDRSRFWFGSVISLVWATNWGNSTLQPLRSVVPVSAWFSPTSHTVDAGFAGGAPVIGSIGYQGPP
jgi:hypothetical protein